ncbi:hypothetical protein [Acetobacter oeni]|uniref:Uncharacterized protein n=1 Tax=Acetobacter oeni TaxID=304077 RepID=A0A511XMM1_9PROT|nr:hypothetical protein [Acetobacter oeni]MBB3884160.1 hypothetical protein [Acetobacter oeni]NHO20162.1 hypothetical protein [Acetobacter oeni]GEN64192.1 hypothetical protein AOE01nite_24160 [Acetobacter oeni]
MFASQTLDIDGVFLGTLIVDRGQKGHRFYAAHDSVRSLHNRVLAEADELRRQAVAQFRRALATTGGKSADR